MVYRRLLLTGVLAFGLILTGCGQKETKTDISYPMQERMEAMTELCPPELKRAETFAEALCVVTEDVPQPDSSVGAEAAAVFSLDDHRVILEKNVFKRLYPASTTKVMTALVSGDADIGFMGSEASIYTYANGSQDYAVNFAQLTQRAGNFLVGREADPAFTWEKLKGKKVLGGRAGGMPSHDVTWEHIRGIYEWTSRKSPDLKVFKYEEKVVSIS